MRSFSSYAAPLAFGPLTEIGSHLGSVSFTITYSAVGSAQVLGRIHYYKEGNPDTKVIEGIASGATIRTANVVANIEIEFRGVPTGSAVNGTVNP